MLSTYEEAKVTIRWLTKYDTKVLLSHIELEWMNQVCRFASATGARVTEILSLTLYKVDTDRAMAWMTNDLAKNGRSIPMRFNNEVLVLLEQRKALKTEWCFTRENGIKVKQVGKRMIGRAVKLAGRKPLKFYDLRHIWANWHVQSWTPLMLLKELGGWEPFRWCKSMAIWMRAI